MTNAATQRDWTEKLDPEFGVIRWEDWAKQTIAAIQRGDDGADAGLLELSRYLDEEYDAGYDGLAVEPLTSLRMGWDH